MADRYPRRGGKPGLIHRVRAGCVGHRLITAIGVAVTVGLLALVTFYTERQEANIKAHNERTMRNVAQSVIESLQTVMLAGYADIAQIFADRLKGVQGVVDFRILRIDGTEAFRDNKTIDEVNRRRGEESFVPRDSERVIHVLPPGHRDFRAALDTLRMTAFYEVDSRGERFLTFLAPILSEEKCFKCHGQAQTVRGMLKLTTSLAPVEADIDASWRQAVIVLAVAITVIMVVTGYLIRRSVVRPLAAISDAMAEVSRGELGRSVPILGQDELGQMAQSFNQMTEELRQTLSGFQHERNKLTTIILSADEGMVVTDPHGKVVLVNPSAEAILGKSADRIIEEGFLRVLDEPERMGLWLAQPGGVRDEPVTYGAKLLAVTVATIVTEGGAVMGSSALIRDVTKARQLEEDLRRRSLTDGLTGLGNRRAMDQALEREMLRTATKGDPLSIMMFDIDHFKKFNDIFGHDQGDRVLQAVADAVRDTVRTVDIPCRFGGEEFLVILRLTGRDGAATIAERLRKTVEDMEVNGQKATISIGVADWHDHRPADPQAFIELADKALYAAKSGGRNRVVVAAPAALETLP